MPQFPEVDPETLLQALKTYITARQNVKALANGNSANYLEVMRGWAEAITAAQNPTNAWFRDNIDVIYNLLNETGGAGTSTLLFNTDSPLAVGQWVYQISSDTVALANSNSASMGPAIGVVVSLPTPSTVAVRDSGSFLYTPGMFPFLPLIPDTTYYVGDLGTITATPNPPSGGYVQEVGYAKNTLQFVLNIQESTLI